LKDSAGYVAIEQITDAWRGRRGSFSLLHNATITRGIGQLTIVVVRDSGTDQLVGLAGKMTIIIEGGERFHELE